MVCALVKDGKVVETRHTVLVCLVVVIDAVVLCTLLSPADITGTVGLASEQCISSR